MIGKFNDKVIFLLSIKPEDIFSYDEKEIKKLESRAFNLETGEEVSLLELALENM